MRIDYEVKKVTETIGSVETTVNDQVPCPICTETRFTVFVHLTDYIDLVCNNCHALVHITAIEGK